MIYDRQHYVFKQNLYPGNSKRAVVLTDLNSLNGCWVNGARIQRPTRIQDGDQIALGEWRALFQRTR